MVLLLEEIKKVSLIKETPSDYLLRRMEIKLECAEVLSFVEWAWYGGSMSDAFFPTFHERDNARYWILHHYEIEFGSDEGEDLIEMAYNIASVNF